MDQEGVVGLATCWTVQGSNPGGKEFSTRVQTEPGANVDSCTIRTGSFLGVKRLGSSVDHSPLPNAKVKERGDL
jgi:hypothetical protein